ncbi:hypothetical protein FOZ76_03430 [Verticiella sediminum]|uniref:SPOR domain-containing protein n=1 Tax=Verticiella sediminum TaxID=1247510 RepID=A0A556AY59_9BURK|nr:SPOR domain-containing protein [Verticiella sediminum]TSH97857.1 hypothetical protein FOZ76_03430 [Verticiella sediminum]
MGFFTRNREGDDDVPGQRGSRPAAEAGTARRRTANNGRDQADELRRRARRRLVGAILMVLVAVVVLPMILDGEPEPTHDNLAVQVPSQAPGQPNLAVVTPPASLTNSETAGRVGEEAPPSAGGAVVDPRVPAAIANITPVPGHGAVPQPSTPTPTPAQPGQPPAAANQPSTAKPEPARPAATQPPPPPPVAQPRTPPNAAAAQKEAEAARALALLQGQPVPPASSGNNASARSGGAERFAVQVVAVRSREGADQLLSRLRGAGLTAYIESITTPDGQVHRVRLGPYNSRSQAESAQAKLRGLPGGYSGSLVPL